MDALSTATLIEMGKKRIAERELAVQLAHEAKERERQAALDAEMHKFATEALAPLLAACPEIQVGDVGEINEYMWEVRVPLVVPLCVTVQAKFELPRGDFNSPRQSRTWKFKRFLVPRVELDKGPDECTEPWTARESFWRGELVATEVADLDEALALASERFAELVHLADEADMRNGFVKTEQAQREEKETKRIKAEQDAFKPFVYYQVTYGVVVSDGDERMVDLNYFDCLRDLPFADGYWLTVEGIEKRVEHLVSVKRQRVKSMDEMPHWVPTVETEWGLIRVPPVVPSVVG